MQNTITITELVTDAVKRYGNITDLYENGVITDMERLLQTHSLANYVGAFKFHAKEEQSMHDSILLMLDELIHGLSAEAMRLIYKARDIERGNN